MQRATCRTYTLFPLPFGPETRRRFALGPIFRSLLTNPPPRWATNALEHATIGWLAPSKSRFAAGSVVRMGRVKPLGCRATASANASSMSSSAVPSAKEKSAAVCFLAFCASPCRESYVRRRAVPSASWARCDSADMRAVVHDKVFFPSTTCE